MQAIILAAGMGKRLGKLTSENTKGMVKVLDKTLIERMMDQLVNNGIKKIIIVIGYKGDKLQGLLGLEYKGATIIYVENPIYNKTNNIYSLFLAKNYLEESDTLLLESDLIFDDSLLNSVIKSEFPNVVVVAKFESWMSGTVVTLDNKENIISFIPSKKFNYNNIDDYYKTVNIYKFSKEFSKDHYLPFLEAYIKSVGHDEYYEDVLRVIAFLEKAHLKALQVGDAQNWYEIDDIQDLSIAEIIFAEGKSKLTKIQNTYGGYWRFPKLIDFCYLVNPYFPTKRMKEEMISNFNVLMSQYPSGMEVNKLIAAKMFNLQADEILPGNGAAELINAFLKTTKKITGIMVPTFEEYLNKSDTTLIKKFKPDNNNFSYNADDIINFSEKVEQVLLINPDNPSGNFIPFKDLLKIVEHFKVNDKVLILDESFVDFSTGGNANTLLSSDILQQNPHLIVMKSISKSYGVPGFRLGILATSNKDILKTIQAELPIWNINSFGEFFMQIIDKHEKEYLKACEKITEVRELFFDNLKDISFLRVVPSQSNYFLCEVLNNIYANELTQFLFSDFNMLIKDCSKKEGFEGQQYIRIAVRDEADNYKMIMALRKMEEKYKSKK